MTDTLQQLDSAPPPVTARALVTVHDTLNVPFDGDRYAIDTSRDVSARHLAASADLWRAPGVTGRPRC